MAHPGSRRLPTWQELIIVAIVAVPTAIGAAYLSIAFMSLPHIEQVTWSVAGVMCVAAAISASVIGPLMWWWLMVSDPTAHYGRGAAMGVITSLVAHPFTWLIAMIWTVNQGGRDLFLTINDPSPGPLVLESLYFSFIGLVYVGWITSLVGGIVGVALGRVLVGKAGAVPSTA